jgi:hypothetical protein
MITDRSKRVAVAFLSAGVLGCGPQAEIRVVNGTGLPLTSVEIDYGVPDPPGMVWRIESLGGAESTAYQRVRSASRAPRARARYGERILEGPASGGDGGVLERGRYSYILRLGGADLLVVAVEREP